MFGSTRTHGPWWLSGVAHFVIIVVAVQFDTPTAWPWALLAMCAVSFFAWLGNYYRYRQIHDLPTSKVASAAQGYVELVGRGERLAGEPLLSRLSRLPCCWYHYEIEEHGSNNEWNTVDQGSSVDHFLLVDDTGRCVISPEGAEVLTHVHRSWREGDKRFSEWLLLPGAVLYAIGEFITHSGQTHASADEYLEVGELISHWKKDQHWLRQRFDLDRDGTIDMKEWELARLQARREVRKRRSEVVNDRVEGVHLLRKPGNGRLFLLANEMPQKLWRRYRIWTGVHLLVFITTGVAALMLLGVK